MEPPAQRVWEMLTPGCGGERGLRLASLHLLLIAFYKILHLQDEVID